VQNTIVHGITAEKSSKTQYMNINNTPLKVQICWMVVEEDIDRSSVVGHQFKKSTLDHMLFTHSYMIFDLDEFWYLSESI